MHQIAGYLTEHRLVTQPAAWDWPALLTDNAAFEDENRGPEIARILRIVAQTAERGNISRALYDINGNRVGTVEGL